MKLIIRLQRFDPRLQRNIVIRESLSTMCSKVDPSAGEIILSAQRSSPALFLEIHPTIVTSSLGSIPQKVNITIPEPK